MPREIQKNTRSGKRIHIIRGSPIPLVAVVNTTRKHGKLQVKIPANLLEPKNLLKAKQKNKANEAKAKAEAKAEATKRALAEEAKRVEEGRKQWNAFLERARASANKKRGPGARGSATRKLRRA